MDQIRWGVLGTATITALEVGPALRAAARSTVRAVGSRRLDRAREHAELLGAERAYGSYDEVLADPEVDAVYIPLPNSLHVDWTIAALEAGKHVLCEKPMSLTAEGARRIAEAAERADRLVMEGFMWRFHPRVARVIELIDSGRIGTVRLVRATYTFDLFASASDVRSGTADEDLRLNPEFGGGALTDLGSYCVNGLRTYSRGRPTRVVSSASSVGGREVETTISGEIQFDNGVVGQFFAALDLPGGGHVEILGEAGRIRMANAFRIRAAQEPFVIQIIGADGVTLVEEPVDFRDQYELEIAHFESLVLDGAEPIVGMQDSIENALVLESIRRSWTEGPVEVGS